MREYRMVMEFEAFSENESFARMVAAAFVTRLDPTLEELSDIKTAVSEAVTNAVIHGYEGNGGVIHMEMTITGHEFYVMIQDYGKGMEDVNKAMEPMYTTLVSEERSGMGFVFMEAFMDSLTVESEPGNGTAVHMIKNIRKAALDE